MMLIFTIKVFLFLMLFDVQSTTMLIDPLTLNQLYIEGSVFYSCQEIDFCLYILSLITPKFKDQVGLYRDDGIALWYVQSDPKANTKKGNKKWAMYSNPMVKV